MESRVVETYRPLWKTWAVLLVLTLIMVFVDVMGMPRLVLVFILLLAMLTKASLIAAQFMDLKHEKLVVSVAVAFSILFFGATLFFLILPDGIAVLHGGR